DSGSSQHGREALGRAGEPMSPRARADLALRANGARSLTEIRPAVDVQYFTADVARSGRRQERDRACDFFTPARPPHRDARELRGEGFRTSERLVKLIVDQP